MLERDAFMLVWSNRLSLPLLDGVGRRASTVPGSHTQPSISLRSTGSRACSASSARLRAYPGALGVGAAAAATVERAWWKALAEAFTARAAGVKLALLEPDADERQVVSFDDHIRRYADHRHASAHGVPRRELRARPAGLGAAARGRERPRMLLEALCARIEAAGSSAYAVDVTAPDVRRARPDGHQGRRSRALRARHRSCRALPRRPAAVRGGGRARAAPRGLSVTTS